MNSEELEQSLKAEFESYLKSVFGEIKQEISGFQEKLDAEFRQHKERVDGTLSELAAKVVSDRELDESFRETVTEHLRLARDEGARITATAFAEAEELHAEQIVAEAEGAGFEDLRDAVNEISRQTTQAEILKSLVHHAGRYTPRGAFFIVKNEHLVGWRVFGQEEHEEPDVVHEVYFPLESKTALSEAVHSLATVGGFGESYDDDDLYLAKLGFQEPQRMYAIPLVARGRGVAVLYADCGEGGGRVNVEALETLVCVSGLTVELLASVAESSHPAEASDAFSSSPEQSEVETVEESAYEWPDTSVTDYDSGPEADFGEIEEAEDTVPAAIDAGDRDAGLEDTAVDHDGGFAFVPAQEAGEPVEPEPAFLDESSFADDAPISEPAPEEFAETFEPVEEGLSAEERFDAEVEELYEVSGSVDYLETVDSETEALESPIDDGPAVYTDDFDDGVPSADSSSYRFETREDVEEEEEGDEVSFDSQSETEDAAEVYDGDEFSTGFEYDDADEDADGAQTSFEAPVEQEREEAPSPAGIGAEQAAVAETAPPIRARFGDRNIDLPIEVSDAERQYHNAARRFARLLVSEIKLYNEQKVREGCEANDLYDRLKEAIDRSREMYEKRVHRPVAEKFDYFNYELVNNLAQGDESKLGDSYPGATI